MKKSPSPFPESPRLLMKEAPWFQLLAVREERNRMLRRQNEIHSDENPKYPMEDRNSY
jgi:hypothetical protein